jgi:hypothetical protein
MGFSSGVSQSFSHDPAPWTMAAALNRARCVDAARKEFIQQRTDELVELNETLDAVQMFRHLLDIHPTAFVERFKKIMEDGNVTALLSMDDLLRKAAEDLAQEQWHKEQA